jgi:hypothetical protein
MIEKKMISMGDLFRFLSLSIGMIFFYRVFSVNGTKAVRMYNF